MEDELGAFGDGAGLQDKLFILVGGGGEVAEGADGVTLDFFVVRSAEQIYERYEEACFNDRGFVGRVDGDVADAGDRGKDQREVGGFEEFEEWRQAAGSDDVELIAFVGREVAKSERRLALNFR